MQGYGNQSSSQACNNWGVDHYSGLYQNHHQQQMPAITSYGGADSAPDHSLASPRQEAMNANAVKAIREIRSEKDSLAICEVSPKLEAIARTPQRVQKKFNNIVGRGLRCIEELEEQIDLHSSASSSYTEMTEDEVNIIINNSDYSFSKSKTRSLPIPAAEVGAPDFNIVTTSTSSLIHKRKRLEIDNSSRSEDCDDLSSVTLYEPYSLGVHEEYSPTSPGME